jgi:hypothetical protein
MAEIRKFENRELGAGDAVIDGLFTGLVAGLGMAATLMLAGWIGGEPPALALSRFAPQQLSAPLSGFLLHLAVSGIYGMAYGVVWWMALRIRPFQPSLITALVGGAIYGLLLEAAAQAILLPGSGSALGQLPIWQLALAHLVYGMVLGLLLYRMQLNR